MRNGQNKRMRGRNHGGHGHGHNQHGHRKNHNPMSRVYESNGPDVKIRGNPSHIAEKYVQLARDAQASGDPISAENYYQHAEHYYRLIAAAQEQFRQNNPHLAARAENDAPSGPREEMLDEDDGDQQQIVGEMPFGTREPQPYLPRDAQPFPQQQNNQPQQQVVVQRPSQPSTHDSGSDIDRLPSFITGGQQPPAQQGQPNNYQGFNQNGHDNQADRFPLHRRRRRHRGSRNDYQGGSRNDDRDDSAHE